MRLLLWIYFFVKCGGLLGCILENVIGITHSSNGLESPMSKFLRVLRKHMPEMHWCVETLSATDYALPHTRVRVFLKGLRKVIGPMPWCLRPFGKKHLREFLGAYPHTPRHYFASNQQRNIKDYEDTIRTMVEDGELNREDVVVIAADRAKDKVYKQQITINNCPTLTTKNVYLVVLSVTLSIWNVPLA